MQVIKDQVRLSSEEVEAIIKTAREVFGERIKIWLFGSRTDPKKRGGDIDLYIETQETEDILSKKLKFLVELGDRIGDQKVDLIIRPFGSEDEISKTAKKTGIRLE